MFERKRKKKAFDIFYKEYNMLDKFNYIKEVMSSCKNVKQLDIAYDWGRSTLWKWFDVMNRKYCDRYDSFDWLTMWRYMFTRVSDLSDDLLKNRNELYQGLTRVK